MHSKERSGVVVRAVDKTRLRRVEEVLGRVEVGLCARINGRKKMALTGGVGLPVTQSGEMLQGDVA